MKLETPFELDSLALSAVKKAMPQIRYPIIQLDARGENVDVFYQTWVRTSDGEIQRVERDLVHVGTCSINELFKGSTGNVIH